jgi:hypothetical protein
LDGLPAVQLWRKTEGKVKNVNTVQLILLIIMLCQVFLLGRNFGECFHKCRKCGYCAADKKSKRK